MRTSLARKLRANPTAAEVGLWRTLHAFRTNGFHFRKHARIGAYLVDFVCRHAGVVIEVDGDTHGTELSRHNDALRDDYLRARGFTVLRFSNQDALENAEGAYQLIAGVLRDRSRNHRGAPPPSPALPARGRVPDGAGGDGEDDV